MIRRWVDFRRFAQRRARKPAVEEDNVEDALRPRIMKKYGIEEPDPGDFATYRA